MNNNMKNIMNNSNVDKQLVHRACRAVCRFMEFAFLIAVPAFTIWWANDYAHRMNLMEASVKDMVQIADDEKHTLDSEGQDAEISDQSNGEDVNQNETQKEEVVAVDSKDVIAVSGEDGEKGFEAENSTTEAIEEPQDFSERRDELASMLAVTGVEWQYQQNLLDMAMTNAKVVEIIENASLYPTYMLETLGKYEQTLDYVYDYREHKDDKIATDVGVVIEGDIPLLLQWDERWGYGTYGAGLVGTSGCGPTCLSMVVVGLTGDTSVTPKVVCDYSDASGFYVAGSGTTWSLMTTGASHYGLTAKSISIDEETVKNELEAGHPIICSVGPGDFTVKGHYIVLTGYKNNMLQINDPNSCGNSGKLWKFDDIKSQFQGLWSYEVDKTDLEQ